ncbi:hypothetical protein TSUD_218760 [Trifolium subterraneum]|uniref:Protein FAR1-RELATED SEQUENCE n=1 Tax=Trifolium subterraneum TaxID=3900 RepID=A0A2Z6N897_TRISU|nr:hypothetical protein TSUD_218760 [Trifolium subterraneum]
MAKGLVEVMPESYHCLCTWHLMQNCIKNLSNLMKGGSHFLTDFKKCVYGYDDEEQFEEAWRNLLVNYEAEDSKWLIRAYTLKEKWASCYIKKAFTLGMRSTQLKEKRYNESKCEYEARQKIPRLRNSYADMLQQMSELYTPTIFDLFQDEYELFAACSIKSMNMHNSSIDYVISMARDLGEWRVFFDLDKKSISCSCRKFESFGILCCHCLRVFIHMDVKSVPEHYILKRWTKSARSGALPNVDVSHDVEDVDFSPKQCYKEICPRLIRIATEACRSQETFTFLYKVVDELDRCILQFQNCQVSSAQVNVFLGKVKDIESSIDGSIQINARSVKIIKNSKNGDLSDSQRQVQYEVPNTSASIWPINVVCNKAPMEHNDATSSFDVTSFTSLLMTNLDEDATPLINP